MKREDIQREARSLDDRRLTEKARTARNSCTDWTRTHQEAVDEPWFWTSDEEEADIQASKKAKDDWCMMAEVFESELRQRRSERPQEVGETVASVDRRRAEERAEREQRYRTGLEADLERQEETSVVGTVTTAPRKVAEAIFSPMRWLGLSTDATDEERKWGLIRLALVAAGLVVAYQFVFRPLGGFWAGQTVRTGEMFERMMDKPLPGV